MTAEVKIRTLASADATLQSHFGAGPFRWFTNGDLPQGYYAQGTCLRMRRISSVGLMEMRGLNPLRGIRFQLDVIDVDAETARAAAAAVVAWFQTISCAQQNQFGSPVTTPPQFPNIFLNQRHDQEFQLQPRGQVEILDYRVWNSENF